MGSTAKARDLPWPPHKAGRTAVATRELETRQLVQPEVVAEETASGPRGKNRPCLPVLPPRSEKVCVRFCTFLRFGKVTELLGAHHSALAANRTRSKNLRGCFQDRKAVLAFL